jgi:acyl carrier protein
MDLETKVLKLFLEVAPDVDAAQLDRAAPFRDQFDFDSMDTLNFAIALNREFSIEIPETDYRHLASLEQAVDYVRNAISGAAAHNASSPLSATRSP